MKPTIARQHFACTRMRAVLSRSACARAHQLANIATPRVGAQAVTVSALDRCRGCPIGAEHRRGKARQPAVVLVPLRVDKPVAVKRCLACGMVLPRSRGRTSYCGPACVVAGRRLRHMELQLEVVL